MLSIGPAKQKKWVRASARKKAFGCRSRQAKRSACPTRGWVKSPPTSCWQRPKVVFRTAGRCGNFVFPDAYFVLRKGAGRETIFPKQPGTMGQIRPAANGRDRAVPSPHSSHTAAHCAKQGPCAPSQHASISFPGTLTRKGTTRTPFPSFLCWLFLRSVILILQK